MTEDIVLTDDEHGIDSFDALTPQKRIVAAWLAIPITDPGSTRDSLKAVALANGIRVATAYRWAKTEEVMEAAKDLIITSLQVDSVPRMWQIVLMRAERNGDFALKVLKFLQESGIDIFVGRSRQKSTPGDHLTVNLNVPGGLEGAIFAMRGARSDADGDD